jgi:hypothetical protein
MLRAQNKDDPDGQALADEFSDAISACFSQAFDGEITLESVTPISDTEA